uniref:Protein SCO1 homolog, mitochondrial n=1 Tax=Steinernema glaseri TaxID=37863 RepID=A0A1I7YZZ8_9BILA
MLSLRGRIVPCIFGQFCRPHISSLSQAYYSSSPKGPSQSKDDLKIDIESIEKSLKEEFGGVKPDEIDKNFMNFRQREEKRRFDRSMIFNWKSALTTLAFGGVALGALLYMRKQKMDEMERQRKVMAGKARIGGDWELLNTNGKLEGSEQLRGSWVLMYFGFTHCPDICPDEIEKMISVVDLLEKESPPIPIVPVFISVDPERDTLERVKQYCEEFSPKLRGFTGNREQVNKVAKTFRVYHSQGPKTAEDDYIVDHTVIMYLIDPDGNFHDYYGQNRKDTEIANVIKMKVLKHKLAQKKSFF